MRDRLLGLPVHERDWVVVGSTPDEMLARGFRQVGNDFPVFLHPDTQEEYALARVERKTGSGHQAFSFDTSASVTLDEDLSRRDLTVNAIAQATDGSLVDPYGGHADLDARLLRHVSAAFSEDPLRVLRAARFATRFAPLGFTIEVDTMRLMSDIVASGEMTSLSAERVWSETARALGHNTPSVYIRILRACGALAALFPELDALFGVPQSPQWHPEIDTGLHTLMAVDMAATLGASAEVRFAVLVHDLGKALTPEDLWPKHHGHERHSARLVGVLCERLRTPKRWQRLATLVAEYHTHCHRIFELRPATLLKMLDAMGAFRHPDIVAQFALACEADARGREGLAERDYPQAEYLLGALGAAQSVSNETIARQGHEGAAFGKALTREREAAIASFKRNYARSTSA